MNFLWNVIGVFLMMAPGFVFAKKGWLVDDTLTALSRIMVWVVYPCLVFTSISENFTLSSLFGAWILPVSVMGIFLCGYLLGWGTSLFLPFRSKEQRGAFLFQCTVNNYSFFPLAIVSGMFGAAGVSALMFSSVGAEIMVWTLGIFILQGEGIRKENLRHLLSPPLLALYSAIFCLSVFRMLGLEGEEIWGAKNAFTYIHSTLKMMGRATIPIAMTISGARLAGLSFGIIKDRMVWLTSFFRAVAIPVIAWLMLLALPLSPDNRSIMIIVAVMPAAAASLFLSQLYGSDRDLISGSFLLTHLMSLITVPALLGFML
jgi:predicted permease